MTNRGPPGAAPNPGCATRPTPMTKLLTAAALLLAAAPATAQSFYPNLYANRYCELRRLGVEPAEARRVAMDESWSNSRQSVMVTSNGKQVSTDVMEAASLVVNLCPSVAQ